MSADRNARTPVGSTATRLRLIGRADLVRLLAAGPTSAHDALATALGWRVRPAKAPGKSAVPTSRGASVALPRTVVGESTEQLATNDDEKWPAQRRPARFWTPYEHEAQESLWAVEPKRSPRGRLHWTNKPTEAARHEPLAAWRTLGPRLRSNLAGLFSSREVDVTRAVEILAEGRADRPLPLRSWRRWGNSVQVIVDRSTRLMPYFADEMLVVGALRKLLGRERVEVYFGSQPDEARLLKFGSDEVSLVPYRAPVQGSHVLVLGDLGVLDVGQPRLARSWLEFGRRIVERGSRPLALTPCDVRRVGAELRRVYRVRGWGPRESTSTGDNRRSELARRLLSLVSFGVRVEPGLLRACRRLLPRADDPGLEADVWQDARFVNRTSEAGELGPPEEIAPLIREFEREPAALRQAVLRLWRQWRTEVGCELYFEELARLSRETRALVDAQDWEDARAAWRLHRDEVLGSHAARSTPLTDYVRRSLWRLTDETRLDPEIGHLALDMQRHFAMTTDGPSPPPPNRVSVFQAGSHLVLRGENDGDPEPAQPGVWSRLCMVRTVGGFVEIEGALSTEGDQTASGDFTRPDDRTKPARSGVSLNRTEVRRIEIPHGDRLTIRTDAETVRLRLDGRPEWADAAGRDRYGAWADVSILGVKTRWRWIPPGSFLMGSPESEPGRWDAEGPQHRVKLTRGFWLADTPCTQCLWEAVMGSNPSYFVDPNRPVEQVSWRDVQKFLKKLNAAIPGLSATLPTESQWEYACRAGSTSALYPIAGTTGEIEILGERNAPALDAIAWYGGNSGVDFELEKGWDSSDWKEQQYPRKASGTHPVSRKAPNGWGLNDMLGNVWEWCADDMRSYSPDAEVDPVGPVASGVESRCIRGGSWDNRARGVRCAIRFQYHAGIQDDTLGFRLARVQE